MSNLNFKVQLIIVRKFPLLSVTKNHYYVMAVCWENATPCEQIVEFILKLPNLYRVTQRQSSKRSVFIMLNFIQTGDVVMMKFKVLERHCVYLSSL